MFRVAPLVLLLQDRATLGRGQNRVFGLLSWDKRSVSKSGSILGKIWNNVTGMDPSKGTFTVEEAGVYQFTFTGFVTSRVSLWLVNLFLTLIGQYRSSGRAHGQCWHLSPERRRGQHHRPRLSQDCGGRDSGQGRWPSLYHQHRAAGEAQARGPGPGVHGHTRQSRQLQTGLGLVTEDHIYWAKNIKLNHS